MNNFNFVNLEYIHRKIDDHNFKSLQNICHEVFESSDKRSANNMLAGQIEHEYVMPPKGDKIILPIVSKAAQETTGIPNWKLNGLWINYQKKYEFNPIHNHAGFFSFVIWIQIPFNLKDELIQKSSRNSNKPCASLFSLIYINPLGVLEQKPFPLDKKDEGTLLMFPSPINHLVYPFYTSDDYRISIAGNIVPTTN